LKYIEPKIHYYLPPHYGIARLQTTRSGNNAALYGAIQ
ncbi:ROK family protein, partial [Streptococcus oralis]